MLELKVWIGVEKEHPHYCPRQVTSQQFLFPLRTLLRMRWNYTWALCMARTSQSTVVAHRSSVTSQQFLFPPPAHSSAHETHNVALPQPWLGTILICSPIMFLMILRTSLACFCQKSHQIVPGDIHTFVGRRNEARRSFRLLL